MSPFGWLGVCIPRRNPSVDLSFPTFSRSDCRWFRSKKCFFIFKFLYFHSLVFSFFRCCALFHLLVFLIFFAFDGAFASDDRQTVDWLLHYFTFFGEIRSLDTFKYVLSKFYIRQFRPNQILTPPLFAF